MTLRKNGSRRKERRKEDADERQEAYDKISRVNKIARLDVKFGKGKGAKKERVKLKDK
jgi:hypothetical protein